MKKKVILSVLFLAGIIIVFISMNTFDQNTGPHGGRIQKSENFTIETKTSYPYFYSYLLSAENKSIPNKGVACEIKFFLTDSTSLDFPLKPYQSDGFRLESNITDYNAYRITFHAFGRSISSKFANENAIVRKDY
jgi:hypothetical protein